MTAAFVLEGDATARGEAHGEQAKDLIAEAADRWRADVAVQIDSHLAALVDASGFRATTTRIAPKLATEIEGIARASGVDVRTVWALNLMDEDWWIRGEETGAEACSGFGIQPGPGQSALIGQNMDLPRWLDGLQVLLDIRPSDGGPRVLAPSYAGMIATNALNEHGIGVCVNTLDQLPTSRDGLPIACMIRHVADQRSFTDATDVIKTSPHASGQNYIVGSPGAVADFECGAGTAADRTGDVLRIAHTNHPLLDEQPAEGSAGHVSNSQARLTALRHHLDAAPAPFGADEALAMLRRAPLCRGSDGDRGFTFYTVVMELSADPVIHLTSGPPSTHAPKTFRF